MSNYIFLGYGGLQERKGFAKVLLNKETKRHKVGWQKAYMQMSKQDKVSFF